MRIANSARCGTPVALALLATASSVLAAAPTTLYWDGARLASIRDGLRDPAIDAALAELSAEADAALERGPYSVMHKELVPPSGDKHDYASYSRYWWPNPDTNDGLPYVRRDGIVNRKLLANGDRNRVGAFYDDVESLALAAYLLNSERHADHAWLLVKTWFLDPATKMNPNVNFGQAVPGRAVGRGVGIIDTRHFLRVLDSVRLLQAMGTVGEQDIAELRAWFSEYLDWLMTSELGAEERSAENNHGAWFAAQAARVALFVDRRDIAEQIIREVRDQRIPASILPDGSQPEELERTRSLHYSLFSLSAHAVVARMGEHVGIDLWDPQTISGERLRAAIEYVRPGILEPESWPHPQLETFRMSDRHRQTLLLLGDRLSQDTCYRLAERSPRRGEDRNLSPLLFTSARGQENVYVVEAFNPVDAPPTQLDLPDLSRFTEEKVRSLAPEPTGGRVSVGRADAIPLLEEAFRGDRGGDLRRRQGVDEPRVIEVESGVVTIGQVVEQLGDPSIALVEDRAVTLRLPLVVQPGATLLVDGQTSPVLRLSTDRGAFVANAGKLFLLDAQISSWSEAEKKPTEFSDKNQFRPFLSSYVRSETYVAGGKIEHLGFAAPTAYGFSISSHPERERGEPRDDWPTGVLVGCEFRGLYYGFYSYEARDVAIVDNLYDDSIVYGIDPHDRSTRLLIAGNTTRNTRQRHGIIGSRGVSHSFIFNNTTYGNTGSGVMLDRQCTDNVIVGNKVYNNGQGIAIYESPSNRLLDNVVAKNKQSGVRIRNSTGIDVQQNTLVANGDYAFEFSARRLDDHAKRAEKGDLYDTKTSVDLYENTVAGNRGLAKANGFERLRFAGVNRSPDAGAVSAMLGFDVAFDLDRKLVFGSELKPYTDRLRELLDNPEAGAVIKPAGHSP